MGAASKTIAQSDFPEPPVSDIFTICQDAPAVDNRQAVSSRTQEKRHSVKITIDDKKVLRVEEHHPTILAVVLVLFLLNLAYSLYLVYRHGAQFQHYLPWAFLAASMGYLVVEYGHHTVFHFDRKTRIIQWFRKPFIGTPTKGELPFSDVEEVRIDLKGPQYLRRYRVELVVAGNILPVNPTHRRGLGVREARMGAARRMVEVLRLPKKF